MGEQFHLDPDSYIDLVTSEVPACRRLQDASWRHRGVDARRVLDLLGGPDRRTLFMLAAEWRGIEQVDEALARRTGEVLVAHLPAPGVGWP